MMDGVCATCLCADRRVVSVKEIKQFTDLWGHIIALDVSDNICWECEAVFRKLWKFYQKALKAQEVLQNKKPSKTLPRLTNLSLSDTKQNNEFIIKQEIKVEPETESEKLEVHHTRKRKLNKTPKESKIEPKPVLKVIYDDDNNDFSDDYLDYEDKIKTESIDLEINKMETNFLNNEGNEMVITTTLFDGTERKLPFDPLEKEKSYNLRVLLEHEMLKMRDEERNSEYFLRFTYKCEKCLLIYHGEKVYKQHLEKKHNPDPSYYVCTICDVRTSDLDKHIAHFVRHYICYHCKNCDYQSLNFGRIVEHQRHEHSKGEHFECKTCGEVFSKHRQLQYHFNKMHKAPSFDPCKICGKTFGTKTGYVYHMRNHEGKFTMYKCDICKKDCKEKFGLKAHMRSHATEINENAFCAECNLQFKNETIYKRHLQINANHREPGVMKYKCSYCDKRFYHKPDCTAHQNAIHLNKRAYVCTICNKDFGRKDALRNHIIHGHDGVPRPRNHICSYCGNRFTSQKVLKNHIRTHTGERPFKCELCSRSFSQKTTLKTHIKGVHNKK